MGWRKGKEIQLPMLDLPIGCEPISVFFDHYADSFMIVLEHSSFPPCQEGCHLEQINCQYRKVLLEDPGVYEEVEDSATSPEDKGKPS